MADPAEKGSPTSVSSSFAFSSNTMKGIIVNSKGSVDSFQETVSKEKRLNEGFKDETILEEEQSNKTKSGFPQPPQICVEEVQVEVEAEIHNNENETSLNGVKIIRSEEREETRM